MTRTTDLLDPLTSKATELTLSDLPLELPTESELLQEPGGLLAEDLTIKDLDMTQSFWDVPNGC